MTDRYPMTILSVIAASLAWIAFGPFPLGSASAQLGGTSICIDGVQVQSGMIPVVIRAIDRGDPGHWDAVKVSRVD